ncbi:MAG: GlsB/YeaQ/YmgE family stress response membrane protein [Myxococcales bacterium]|nr:GlsB/YeaQ/YmgE family stress response membrane protein [Myxococcales bacterium]
MDLLTWLIVGLVAGLLASALLRDSGYGLLGDIALGIGGAMLGSWGFRELGWKAPMDGIGGVIIVATIGAMVLLLALRVVQRLNPGMRRR